MDLQKRLQNKLDWLKSTKGIKTADAKLTVEELETIVGLINSASQCHVPEGADLLPPVNIRNDRDMLNYLHQAFETEEHVCDKCHASDPARNTDSAMFLREYLSAPRPSVVGAVAITVWKDGRWKMWRETDARLACDDPDWLSHIPLAAPIAAQEQERGMVGPVAWMHDDPERFDVIHDEVKTLLQKAGGYLHRPLDRTERYTIPLYAAPYQGEQK